MSLKQTQTVELPPMFEEDFHRLKAESDNWVEEQVATTRQFDHGEMAQYRRLARSAFNFNTVAASFFSDYQAPLVIRDEQDELVANVPSFFMPKVLKYDRQLRYFSRCATYPYPGIANKIGSIDILMNNQLPWFRQLVPNADDETADRLLMTRILSECLESTVDGADQQNPYRLEIYEQKAEIGIKPMEIEEFRRLVGTAVATSLND